MIDQFKKGKYNVLVATCIGEEGLDIGDVDLVICYDSSSSPVRMVTSAGKPKGYADHSSKEWVERVENERAE